MAAFIPCLKYGTLRYAPVPQGFSASLSYNLRVELRSLLLEMGNTIVPMDSDDDHDAKKRLQDAGAFLDTEHNSAVAKANDISPSEYRARKSKDYLKPEEVYECEKFRIRDSYGMEVTESLVEKDEGGRLVRAIASMEAILSEPGGTVVDPHTNREYPAPPKIVADKDYSERDKLPLSMDWGNYSARWLARFNLGLHDILKRLVAGSEITADDPHLVRMTEIAIQCAAHIKAILGFTVPADCQPIWLLATLIEQLGLKLVNRKEGPRGEQVKIHSLAKQELEFALHVIAHRERKRARQFATRGFSQFAIVPKCLKTVLGMGLRRSRVSSSAGVLTCAGVRCWSWRKLLYRNYGSWKS
ncbi:MAG: hypothetical protein KME21_31395 [Desmonostoc vinosum HA7617-LM4]|nr:hypothetical protein [Desmonostoc vinosum HA7617-LM4]